MKKTIIRLTALVLSALILCMGGAGVYADDGIMPLLDVTNNYELDLAVYGGSAVFKCSFQADADIFDHAELEMTLQKKGLLFWGDVDIQITEMWFYNANTNQSLRQDIPDETGKYRALYTLRIVGNNGLTDTIEQTVNYTYN